MKGGGAQSQQDSVFILSEFYEYTVKQVTHTYVKKKLFKN